MSATLNVGIFLHYFSQGSHLPLSGQEHPVKIRYLQPKTFRTLSNIQISVLALRSISPKSSLPAVSSDLRKSGTEIRSGTGNASYRATSLVYGLLHDTSVSYVATCPAAQHLELPWTTSCFAIQLQRMQSVLKTAQPPTTRNDGDGAAHPLREMIFIAEDTFSYPVFTRGFQPQQKKTAQLIHCAK
ncbi:ATP-binding protein PRP16 [Fusarium pseudoanthophilum]|uniref:ATP-binding protein PRP16 n=1 Tax=Fusarium pseudoanthophilum TaxID=48495 RepID=A0A8H5NX85_9HYPO|nr:ATP-binding protein PRP16 [Fusarium pseudoanthophilum]